MQVRGLAVAVLLCATVAGCGGNDETAPQRTAPPAEPSGPLRYGVVGDSYSNGEGLSAEQAWPVLLAQRMGLELVVNTAVSGWTTELALTRELPTFERARPEVATVLIGANDIAQNTPAPAFRARLRRLLRAMVRIVGAPRRVLAVTLPDFSIKPSGRLLGAQRDVAGVLRRFNAIIRAESAAQGVPVADIFTVSQRPTDPSPDGLHPSLRELEAWTDAIEPVARRAWRGLE